MLKKVLLLTLSATIIFAISCSSGPDIEGLEKKAISGDKSARTELMNILSKNEKSSVRAAAARALGNAKVTESNSILLSAFDMDDDTVRQELIVSMGKVGVLDNLKPVIEVWNSSTEKSEMKLKALESMGYFNDNKALDILVSQINSDDQVIKNTAIKSLGNSKLPKASEPLLKILEKDNTNMIAAQSLVNMKDKKTYKALISILNNKINNYEFDDTFVLLIKLLSDEKYVEAKDVFAKGYLFIPESSESIKKELLKALKNINLDTSYVVVTASTLNLRSKPNTRASVTGSLDAGELASVLEVSPIMYQVENMQDYWYNVKTEKNKTGWLYGGYLKKLEHKKLKDL